MPDPRIELKIHGVNRLLEQKGLEHLKVTARGKSIAIYSEHEGVKENRCRFTYDKADIFILSMAGHNGKWEQTPFEGTIEELLEMILTQFPWTLCDYAVEDTSESDI